MNSFSDGVYSFFIPGKLPGLNEYTNANRSNPHIGAKLKKDTENLIMMIIQSRMMGAAINEPVFIKYTWIEQNQRRDLDNISFAKKFIQDSLVKVGVLKNDGWKNITGFEDHFEVNKKEPGVLVEIVEVEDDQRIAKNP
ncbi:RusA family crossover junction endodeoxyribonuclease [Acetobacterium malicum]|uniref:RusA family crossover junction endodeoxyribonuclease n=1 Tax=Acetobacterium malicum TaxID=52692 RepID=A0ABR6Z1P3_9FIRM|nr:hypothetical protein [Acetobacterium malicum]MBC3901397.1 RusA family crossover junction endodeoxyribonuclease [Acetobacterium malicum]